MAHLISATKICARRGEVERAERLLEEAGQAQSASRLNWAELALARARRGSPMRAGMALPAVSDLAEAAQAGPSPHPRS